MKKLLLLLCILFYSNALFSAAAAGPSLDLTDEHWAAFLTTLPQDPATAAYNPEFTAEIPNTVDMSSSERNAFGPYVSLPFMVRAAPELQKLSALAATPAAAAAEPSLDLTAEHWAAFSADPAEPVIDAEFTATEETPPAPAAHHVLVQQFIAQQRPPSELVEYDMFENPMPPIVPTTEPGSYGASAAAFVQPMPAAPATAPTPNPSSIDEWLKLFAADPAALREAAQVADPSLNFTPEQLAVLFVGPAEPSAPTAQTTTLLTDDLYADLDAKLRAEIDAALTAKQPVVTTDATVLTPEQIEKTIYALKKERKRLTDERSRHNNPTTFASTQNIKKIKRTIKTIKEKRAESPQQDQALEDRLTELENALRLAEERHKVLKDENKAKKATKQNTAFFPQADPIVNPIPALAYDPSYAPTATFVAPYTLQPAPTAQAAATPADDPYAAIDAQLYATVAAFAPSPSFLRAGSTPQAFQFEPTPRPKESFFCPHCNKTYAKKGWLWNHIKSHSSR